MLSSWASDGGQRKTKQIITACIALPQGWVLAHKYQCMRAIMMLWSDSLRAFPQFPDSCRDSESPSQCSSNGSQQRTKALISPPSTWWVSAICSGLCVSAISPRIEFTRLSAVSTHSTHLFECGLSLTPSCTFCCFLGGCPNNSTLLLTNICIIYNQLVRWYVVSPDEIRASTHATAILHKSAFLASSCPTSCLTTNHFLQL